MTEKVIVALAALVVFGVVALSIAGSIMSHEDNEAWERAMQSRCHLVRKYQIPIVRTSDMRNMQTFVCPDGVEYSHQVNTP